jgi:hypothetical protein
VALTPALSKRLAKYNPLQMETSLTFDLKSQDGR